MSDRRTAGLVACGVVPGIAALITAMMASWPTTRVPNRVLPVVTARVPAQSWSAVPRAARAVVLRALAGSPAQVRWKRAEGGFRADSGAMSAHGALGGVVVSGAGGASLALAVVGVGRPSGLERAHVIGPSLRRGRLVYTRGLVTEWYASRPTGLEQGFTVLRRPAGHGPLLLSVGRLSPGTIGSVSAAGSLLSARADGSATPLTYGSVVAHDALRRALRARIVLSDRRIILRVDDAGTRYPVRIDPLVEQAELTASDADRGDCFGCSIALSGGTLVVGAKNHLSPSGRPGAVYVFTDTGGQWKQSAELQAPSGAELFSQSVAVSGSTIVVGSPQDTVNGLAEAGAAYVYSATSGSWQETARLSASDLGPNDYFGWMVAASGSSIAVSAWNFGDNNANNSGTPGVVYVFGNTAGTWSQTAELTTSDHGTGDYVGFSLAFADANTLIAGAPGYANSQGGAFVFSNGPSGWAQTAVLTPGGATTASSFAYSVAAEGVTAVVGAPGQTVGASQGQGAAYVFNLHAGSWQQSAELVASDGTTGDGLGAAVSVDGGTVVAGAPNHGPFDAQRQGALYAFTSIGTTWQQTELTPADGFAGLNLGNWVAAGDGMIFGSTPRQSVGDVQSGAVYMFDDTSAPVPVVDRFPPTVSGQTVVGKTLTDSHGRWDNGVSSYTYQWLDCSPRCAPIAGATGQTYTLGVSDVGDTVAVAESAVNANGISTPSRSTSIGPVVASAPMNSAVPTISGPANVAATLVEAHGQWSPAPSSYADQWEQCDASGGGCVGITGATGQSYVPVAGDIGHTIRVAETATNAGGTSAPVLSVATSPVQPALPPYNDLPPTISGIYDEGQAVTESHGSWENNPSSFAYQWQQCDGSGGGCSPIVGATGQSYVLSAGDVGHAVRVQEIASNIGGAGRPAASAATPTIDVPAVPVGRSAPAIFGSAVAGGTLVESHGSWSNHPLSYSYQWEDCDGQGANCTPVTGATGQSDALGGGDVGRTVRVVETAANAGGSSAPIVSGATAVVIASVPVNTQVPTVSGQAIVGATLTESHGSWAGAPSLFTYRWLVCDSSGGNCSAIPGATSQSYTVAVGDAGSTLRAEETAANSDGPGAPAQSAPSAVVVPPGPVNITAPAISGAPLVGQRLIEAHGGWTNDPLAYSYQWAQCDSAGQNCTEIASATDQTYVLGAGDVGHTILVAERAVSGGGVSAAARSAPIALVEGAPSIEVITHPHVNADGTVGLSTVMNPEGLPTTVSYQYGIDPSYLGGSGAVSYTDSTPHGQVGATRAAAFTDVAVDDTLSKLDPSTLYHVRFVASNDAGTTYGPDLTFRTLAQAPITNVQLGQSILLSPVSGTVMFRAPRVGAAADSGPIAAQAALIIGPHFLPLNSAQSVPPGSQIDARRGTLRLTAASPHHHRSVAEINGGLFTLTQPAGGATASIPTITLLENAFPGAPGRAICARASPRTTIQAVAVSTDGPFITSASHATATSARGTWTMTARCDGILIVDRRGIVAIGGPRHLTRLHPLQHRLEPTVATSARRAR